MRKLIILLTLSQCLMAQSRENKPLPVFSKKPVRVLDQGITGWSLSLDGQWVSDEMTIPVRLISANEDQYKTRVNSLGNDNIEELQLYPVLYGKDTLVMLVKLYRTGSYKYERTQKGWDDHLVAYYFVTEKEELDKLQTINVETTVIEMEMRDFGLISNTRKKDVLENIQKKMIIKPGSNRYLTFMARKMEENGTIQFQFASLHDVFKDVEGVLHDFQLRGKSLYGKDILLDYIYYEIDANIFRDFFSLPQQITFATNQ